MENQAKIIQKSKFLQNFTSLKDEKLILRSPFKNLITF
jgi:hypothetical protein